MIVASDLEGTLTEGYSWKGMVGYLKANGQGAAYNAYAVRTLPGIALARLHVIDRGRYMMRWLEGVLRFFKGMTAEDFGAVADWIVAEEMWPKRREDVLAELRRHAQDGQRVIVTSGGYLPIVERFAERAGLSEVIATSIEVSGGRLTGRVAGPPNGGAQKADHLRAYLDGASLDVAYGDTLPDVPMLELSHTPVAVYPDPKLARYAARRGWRVLDNS